MLRSLVFSVTILLGGTLPPCCCHADPDPDEEVAKELKALAGTWADDHTPRAEGKDGYDILTFDGNKLAWETVHTVDGKPVSGAKRRLEITLNPKANPKEINLTWTTGLGEKASKFGIYAIDGDKLTICLGYGKNRPKKLAGPGLLLVLKKRQAKERKGDMEEQN